MGGLEIASTIKTQMDMKQIAEVPGLILSDNREKPTFSERQPKLLQNAIAEVVSIYGSSEKFLKTLNPSVQIRAAANIERAYMGKAPRLSVVCGAYSQKVAEIWLMAQLENMNDFCGVKQKMTIPQMRELAQMLIVEVYYLKVSELMLFFHRFKSGKYGEFYGVVDPQKIMSGINAFLRDRMDEIAQFERIAAHKRIEEESKRRDEHCITHEEYLKIKSEAENEKRG